MVRHLRRKGTIRPYDRTSQHKIEHCNCLSLVLSSKCQTRLRMQRVCPEQEKDGFVEMGEQLDTVKGQKKSFLQLFR